jgi:Tol biopolymer transport system component
MRRSLAILALSAATLAAQQQPFTVEAMLKIARISDPQLSPDGKTVTFTVQTVEIDKNIKPSQIYIVSVSGGSPRAITHDSNNERPRWAPDSRHVVFTSTRGGTSQIWIMDPDGTASKQLTHLSSEAEGASLSPDGKKIVFLSRVYPDCSVDGIVNDSCNKERIEIDAKSNVKARIYTSLLYRHWTQWRSKRRQHLLSMDIEGGPVKDLTPGNRDVPPFSLGGPEG